MKCDIDFNKLRDRAFETAKAHGWHDKEYSNGHWLMLVITEIAEAVQADRKSKHVFFDDGLLKICEFPNDTFETNFEWQIKGTVEEELTDIIIRCLDLGGLRGIDFDRTNKMLEKLQMKDVQATFTEVMFDLCGVLTHQFYNLSYVLCLTIAAVIAYCDGKGINIEWLIEQKMKYNEIRSYKHGGKAY